MPQFVLEAENHTTFLIVYFFNGDQTKMGEDIEKVKKQLIIMNLHWMNLKCGKETSLLIAIKREAFNGRLFPSYYK